MTGPPEKFPSIVGFTCKFIIQVHHSLIFSLTSSLSSIYITFIQSRKVISKSQKKLPGFPQALQHPRSSHFPSSSFKIQTPSASFKQINIRKRFSFIVSLASQYSVNLDSSLRGKSYFSSRLRLLKSCTVQSSQGTTLRRSAAGPETVFLNVGKIRCWETFGEFQLRLPFRPTSVALPSGRT